MSSSSKSSKSSSKSHKKTKSSKRKTPKSLTSELGYLPEPEVIGMLDTPTQTFAQFHGSSNFFVPSGSLKISSSPNSVLPDHLNELLLESIQDDADAILSNPMLVSSQMLSSGAVPLTSTLNGLTARTRAPASGGVAMWVFISIAIVLFIVLLASIIYASVMSMTTEQPHEAEIDIYVERNGQKKNKNKKHKDAAFAEPVAKMMNMMKPAMIKKNNGLSECSMTTLKALQDKTFQDDMVVLFVADFCHFCKDLKPIAQEVAMDPDVVEMCTITQEKGGQLAQELAKTYNVRGFPTIMRFSGKTKSGTVFQNARTKEAIKEFAKR